MERKYHTLKDFYPYYLTEHSDPTCRLFHYVGTTLLLGIIVVSIVLQAPKLLFLIRLAMVSRGLDISYLKK